MIAKTYDQAVEDLLDPAGNAGTSFFNMITIESQGVKQIYSIQVGYSPISLAVPIEAGIVGAVIVAEGSIMDGFPQNAAQFNTSLNPFSANRNNFAALREAGLTRIIKFLFIKQIGTTVIRFSDTRPLRASQNAPLSVIQTAAFQYDSTGPVYIAAKMLASLQIDGETIQQGIEGKNKSPFKDLV